MVQGLVAGTTHSTVTEAGVLGMVERRCEAEMVPEMVPEIYGWMEYHG